MESHFHRVCSTSAKFVWELVHVTAMHETALSSQEYSFGLLAGLQDLRDLFRIEPEELLSSTTQKQLHDLHATERNVTTQLAEHLELLQTLPCYAGKRLLCQ